MKRLLFGGGPTGADLYGWMASTNLYPRISIVASHPSAGRRHIRDGTVRVICACGAEILPGHLPDVLYQRRQSESIDFFRRSTG